MKMKAVPATSDKCKVALMNVKNKLEERFEELGTALEVKTREETRNREVRRYLTVA